MRKARLGLESIEREAERLRTLLPGEWDLIAESALTGSAASVTLSSIPGDYRALVLLTQLRTDVAGENDGSLWRANGDTGNNYDRTYGTFVGNNTSFSGGNTGASSAYCTRAEGGNARASNFANGLCWWPGYALTDREKASFTPNTPNFGNVSAVADLYIVFYAGRWRNTAAITSLTFLPSLGANFVSGSRFTLYGVL